MSKIEHFFGRGEYSAVLQVSEMTPAQAQAFDAELMDSLTDCDGFCDDESPFDFFGLALTSRQEDELEVYETMRRQRLAEMAEF